MLSQLHIENVAVIENADLDLEKGLNILTGETGAGKSILIDSINLVLGERVSKEIVRTGSESAHVTALFTDISESIREKLRSLGYECEDDGSLLISREITADGRSSCRISGRPATVSIVREIGRMLINIHGQHENQALLSADRHGYYLDRYAGLSDLLSRYDSCYQDLQRLKRKLHELATGEAEKARRTDLLNYQIGEIESASLRPGEEEELESRRAMIVNSGKIAQSLEGVHTALTGGEDGTGAQALVSSAADYLNEIIEVYPDVKPLAERITGLSYELDDCVSELRGFSTDSDYGEEDIDEIEQRIDTIYRMKLKYGESIPEILKYLENAHAELNTINCSEETQKKLSEEISKKHAEAAELASQIRKLRVSAAAKMEKQIIGELSFLEMPNVRFNVNVKLLDGLSPNGTEEIEFLISANPGSPLRPLAKIASGGEISRVMLAIKNVLAGNDDIDTLIFDEIDTGVSGRAAQKIGQKLREVAKTRQVVCVTHLAQIASQAERHILIEKKVVKNNTYTSLRVLDLSGRIEELARIIGGVNITETTKKNAYEMLESAGIR